MRITMKVKSMPTAAQLRAALEKKVMEAGERRAQRARRLRCPEHAKAATIKTTLTTRGDIRYTIASCCETMRKRVRADLSKA